MTIIDYEPLPTMRAFHASSAPVRCIVGPVGSGKTSAMAFELCYKLPWWIARTYGIFNTRWVLVRNTYVELMDTDFVAVTEQWFPFGAWAAQHRQYTLEYPPDYEHDIREPLHVEVLFRSCDRPEEMKKFKSLELTGCWIDESIEVHEEVKRMIKNRIGRYPRMQDTPAKYVPRYLIESTNPCDVEHPMYWQYKWFVKKNDQGVVVEDFRPPGPVPGKKPLPGHVGFWQKPRENEANLRPGYYDALTAEYAATPEWGDMMVEGKPGMRLLGKLCYKNFRLPIHCATIDLPWKQVQDNRTGETVGVPLYAGWDTSGNMPAAVIGQEVGPLMFQVLHEWWVDTSMNIVDFAKWVYVDLQRLYAGGQVVHYGDPAGKNQFARAGGRGELTSNVQLIYEEVGIQIVPSEQNLDVRISAVDQMLARRDGIFIDRGCTRLINGFQGGYVRPEVFGSPGLFHDKPRKNIYSHIHDALQYLLAKLYTPTRKIDIERRARLEMNEGDVDAVLVGLGNGHNILLGKGKRTKKQYDPHRW